MIISKNNKNKVFITILLIILIFDFSIYLHLSSFSSIRQEFQINESLAQLGVTINIFGIGFSSLFYGMLSDLHGRKKIILFGVLLFTVSNFLLSITSDICIFFILRFIQGLGMGTSSSVGIAVIHDIYIEKIFINMVSMLHTIVGVASIVYPPLSSYIQDTTGWRNGCQIISFFSYILFLYCLLKLPETCQNLNQLSNLKKIIINFLSLFKNLTYIKFLIIKSVVASIAFINISNLSLLFIEIYKVNVFNHGLLIALGSLSFVIGRIICHKLIIYFSIYDVIYYSLYSIIASSLILLLIEPLGFLTPANITFIKIPYLIGIANIFSNTTCKMMNTLLLSPGNASSTMTMFEMLVSVIGARIVNIFYNGTMYPVEIYSVISTLISATGLLICNI